MNALSSLRTPNAEENHNVQSLLNSTQEIEDRYKIIWRWWRVWRPDVRAGWVVLGRFKVTHLPIISFTGVQDPTAEEEGCPSYIDHGRLRYDGKPGCHLADLRSILDLIGVGQFMVTCHLISPT